MRTTVVTGSASGIGRATSLLLAERGDRVIGVDRRDAEVLADLGSPAGRADAVAAIRGVAGDALDGVVACAGVGAGMPGVTAEAIVRINYFGAVELVRDLRPLLALGSAPRACIVASVSMLTGVDDGLLEACLAGDETLAVDRAAGSDGAAYATTKRAIARWVRRTAVTPDWAGAGIALNAVSPGAIRSAMTKDWVDDPVRRAEVLRLVPTPFRGVGDARDVGALLAWLTGPDNGFVTGQVLFVDGGHEALTRGEEIWP